MKKIIFILLMLFPCIALASPETLPNTWPFLSHPQKDGRIIRVGVLQDTPPLAFSSSRTEIRGLAVDLALMLNYPFRAKTIFHTGSLPRLMTMLENGSIDYICGISSLLAPDNPNLSLITSLGLNRRILVGKPDVHVTCEQDFSQKKIIILSNDPYAETAEKAGAKLITVETYQEALNKLSQKEAEAFVAPSGEVASYLAQQLNIDNISLMGLSLERFPLLIVVGEGKMDLLSHLSGILSNAETAGTLNDLREKWLGRKLYTPPSLWDRYQKIILYISIAGVLAFLSAIFWSVALKRRVIRITKNLQRSEMRYRELIEASPDLILLLDQEGHVLLANPIARQILCCHGDDARALLDVLCEQEQMALAKILRLAFSGKSARMEITLNNDTKDARLLEFLAFPTTAENGDNPYICCIARDMTVRQRMEKELAQVERQALIGKLAAGVAHEVNNPLGIILTNAEVLMDSAKDEVERMSLKAIQRNVERAATITRRLLHLAVPSAMTPQELDLAELVYESLAFVKPQLKNTRVDLSGLHSPMKMRGDKALLEQVIINLLLNAMEAMDDKNNPSGKAPELSIEGFANEKEHSVILIIHDNGKGITRENVDHIFDMFFTTRGAQGFGLGLYVSKSIIDQHKGFIRVESEPVIGTSFILEFPSLDASAHLWTPEPEIISVAPSATSCRAVEI